MKSRIYTPNKIPGDNCRHTLQYVLTERDLLLLYSFMTPGEVIRTFGEFHCPTERTIYNIYRKYGLAKPLQAKKLLKQIIVAACPEDCLNEEWEAVAKEKFEAVKQMHIANIKSVIGWHHRLFDDEAPPQLQAEL